MGAKSQAWVNNTNSKGFSYFCTSVGHNIVRKLTKWMCKIIFYQKNGKIFVFWGLSVFTFSQELS